MRRIIKYLLISIIIGVSAIFLLKYYIRWDEAITTKKLKIQGVYLISKINAFKEKHHRLPESMDELYLNLPADYPIYYDVSSNKTSYSLGFEVAPFESVVYFSELNQWVRQHD